MNRVRSLSERLGARKISFGIGLGVLVVLLVATRLLSFGLYGDEVSFLPTSLALTDPAVSWSTRLSNYGELATPLSFLVFGVAARLTGNGPEAARFVSWLATVAIVVIVACANPKAGRETPRAVIGIITNPYVLLTSVLVYSDGPAAALCVGAMFAHRRKHHLVAAILFALAIATRQFSIVFPLAIVATAWWPTLRSAVTHRSWTIPPPREWAWSLLAACSYGIWVVVLGGVTNDIAVEVRGVPEAQESTLGIEPSASIHALAVLAVYFVAVEIILRPDRSVLVELRSWRPKHSFLVLAAFMAAFAFPVVLNGSGAVLNVAEHIPSASVRTVVFALLASAVVVRFSRGGIETWIVIGHAAVMAKSYQWDKYAMVVIAVLWLLSAYEPVRARKRRDLAPVDATTGV